MRHGHGDADALLGGDLGARLEAWAADARVREAADARARERWLRSAAAHDATFVGVLVDLAEAGTTAVVRTTTSRRHRGVVRAVTEECAVLRTDALGDVVLALTGIAEVRPEHGARSDGTRRAPLDLTLAEVLDRLAPDRPRVGMTLAGGEALAGELRTVGRDVVTLLLDGQPRSTAYVRVGAIVEAWLA
jgi:hypothetical protein